MSWAGESGAMLNETPAAQAPAKRGEQMTSSDGTQDADEVWQLVQRMNDAWAKGSGDLALFFREDIVMVNPGFTQRTEGRDACVASYEDFCKQAVILDFKMSNPGIDVFGNTAIATYSYEIAYEMGGERFNDTGRDIFVFVRENDRWQAVWRTMIVSQAESVN
ncbi:MAG: nuclear transport factor 2 family protein [Terriglobia bacterium]